MKLKTLLQIMIVSCGILGLTACSSMHKNGDGTNGSGDGANAYGAGGNGAYGDSDPLSKHVYYFEYDRSEIRDEDKQAIIANAENIISHPSTKVLLEGHTDPRGSREYNVALGERRAKAVAELMESKGVNPAQIRVVSYGAERLAAPGHDEQAFQQDRRVVLVYLER
jgi:peptidoglycan-associated lipoprotein